MRRAQEPKRAIVARAVVLACMLAALCSPVSALNPSLDVSQYAHTAWKIREGFTKGEITAIAQTPDGYLWLGTDFGLNRFDGVRVVPWQPPPAQHLPSEWVTGLLAARDGTLWIATLKGLASWKNGKLTQYSEVAGTMVFRLLEDHEGTVWAGVLGFTPSGRLCSIRNSVIHCYGEDGGLGYGVMGLYEDRKQNLWVGVANGVWRWKPGPPRFYPLPGEANGIRALGEDADGTLLVGWKGRIWRFVDGKAETIYSLPKSAQANLETLFRDRDGGLWVGTYNRGLVHMHQGRTDVFAQSDGLSNDNVHHVFEDREGDIWVLTANGLDRFRSFPVVTFSGNQGLSGAEGGAVLVARDGTVWLGTKEGLKRWSNGQTTTYPVRVKPYGKLNGQSPNSLFEDSSGRIWASTLTGFGYLENDRFNTISSLPGVVHSITEDSAGNLWIANQEHGLIRLSRKNEVEQIPWASLGRKNHFNALVADRTRGGLWAGFYEGGIGYFRDGQLRKTYGTAEGLGDGVVNEIRLNPDGSVWVATDGGLSRVKDGHVATLTSKNGLPCDAVHWTREDAAYSLWLRTACGLIRIPQAELAAWVTAVDANDDANRTIHGEVFDNSDGVRFRRGAGGYTPHSGITADGRLWFADLDGVSVIDPTHLALNKIPPPVHVEQITADHTSYEVASGASGNVSLRLPPRIRDLEIDYTALSLVAPEKVRFRYKLEGWDHDWQEAGTRRQAFYTNLAHGSYTFRVMACNNSGVWNEAGTSLDFSVAPAYYQTNWFRFLCVATVLGLTAAIYLLRMRQLERQYAIRLEERVSERTRIARDLHDTLLQSFQGILLKFHAVTYFKDLPPEAKVTLAATIEQARQAITDGRDAVQGLRSSIVLSHNIAAELSVLGDELTQEAYGSSPAFRVLVEGAPQDLAPLVRDEAFRITSEAVRNAFRHAQATCIEVEVRYHPREFRLRIRDNGKGIGPEVLADCGRDGHYGLRGMHERAKLVGGRLAVWSELDSGTEAELSVPAAVAYAKAPARRRTMFWRKGA